MIRTTLTTLAGVLVGVGLTVLILRLTNAAIGWMTAPRIFEIEYGVIYQTVVLGACFGGLCGAVVGLAGVLARCLRDRPSQGTK